MLTYSQWNTADAKTEQKSPSARWRALRWTHSGNIRHEPTAGGKNTHTHTHFPRTHLQHVVAAEAECFQVGQMFHHLGGHDGVELGRPLLLPASALPLRWELLQRAGPVADPVAKVRVDGRMQLGRTDAVAYWINAQHVGTQATQGLVGGEWGQRKVKNPIGCRQQLVLD